MRKSKLTQLRDLVENGLPEAMAPYPASVRRYGTSGESAVSVGLMRTEEVAVAYTQIKAGTEFPRHTHINEREWIICYHGRLTFHLENGERHTLSVGQGLLIEKGMAHKCVVDEGADAWIIAISIPPAEGFPDA